MRTFYFKIYSRDFVNQHVFLLLDLHWDSPKLPWGMQRICAPFCFGDYHYAFQETLCPVTLAHYCILFKSIFLYLWYIPPHSCAIVSYVYYHAKHFSYPWWRCCSEVNYCLQFQQSKASFELFFFLTFIVLMQLNFPWNVSTNLLIFTNKASSHVVIV